MSEYLWILASLLLAIGFTYATDSINTDKKSGDMDWYIGVIAITGVIFVYRFICNIFMKKYKYEITKV